MRKLFKERKLFKGGNYMRKYGIWAEQHAPYIRFLPKTSQEGFECATAKECPNIYTVAWAEPFLNTYSVLYY